MRSTALILVCLLSTFTAVGSGTALGQDVPPPMGLHDHGGPGGPGGPEGPRGMGGPVVGRLLPPGIWWRQSDLVQALSLSSDQQKKMDDIFQQSRIQLVHMVANLEEERIRLEPMLDASPFDSGKVMGEVDKIANLRAELEKADARMLLGLRGVLNADQWAKLQTLKRSRQMSGRPDDHGGHLNSSHNQQRGGSSAMELPPH